MSDVPELYNQVQEWNRQIFLFEAALKQVNCKIDILNQEFMQLEGSTPIEHVNSRLKTPESIVKKLKRHGVEVSIPNMMNVLSDIAGIRIICSFTSDIYRIAERISNQKDITVVRIKDYIKNPKPNGYKSYHMVITVPVYLTEGPVDTKVEIQIRTVAMDFWASLEHKILYKFEGAGPVSLQKELKNCADMVDMLDEKMYSLNKEILEWNRTQKHN